jgi:integrase
VTVTTSCGASTTSWWRRTSCVPPRALRRFVTLSFQAGKDLVYVQSQVGHADWKTTLDIYTQVSHRTIDAEIRELLEIFFGEPHKPDEATVALAARGPYHER